MEERTEEALIEEYYNELLHYCARPDLPNELTACGVSRESVRSTTRVGNVECRECSTVLDGRPT
jgi:hypothetical protein